jgi:hypothetical protein
MAEMERMKRATIRRCLLGFDLARCCSLKSPRRIVLSTDRARGHNFGLIAALANLGNGYRLSMRHLSVWIVEFIKLLIGQRPHPLSTQCPICQQTVHLHVNRAGRRHVFGHARGLYQGCRLCKHYVGRIKCLGSGARMLFDPHPNERQYFKLPDSLLEK